MDKDTGTGAVTGDQWGRGHLVDLTVRECTDLLGERRVGRVAWCSTAGPVVIPINFVFHDGAVWMRSTPYSSLAREWNAAGMLAFQVDEVDEFTESGWSVLVRGTGRRRLPDEIPTDLPGLASWPEGPRPFVVSLDARELTGKRLIAS